MRHPIGQNSQLVKRSLGPQSQLPDPESQIPNPRSQIPNPGEEKNVSRKKSLGRKFFWPEENLGRKTIWAGKQFGPGNKSGQA